MVGVSVVGAAVVATVVTVSVVGAAVVASEGSCSVEVVEKSGIRDSNYGKR